VTRLAFAALLGLWLANPAAGQGVRPGENLQVALPPGYKAANQQRSDKMALTEVIPQTETLQSWTRLIAIQVHFGARTPLQALYEGIAKRAQADCPGGHAALTAQGESNGYPFATWQLDCPANPAGKPEYSTGKAIAGNDSLYIVVRTVRAPGEEERAASAVFLQSVSLCDTRIKERACPQPAAGPTRPASLALKLVTPEESAQLDALLAAGSGGSLRKPIAGVDLSPYRQVDNSVLLLLNVEAAGLNEPIHQEAAQRIAAHGLELTPHEQSQAGIASIFQVYEAAPGKQVLELMLVAFDRARAAQLVRERKGGGPTSALQTVLQSSLGIVISRVPVPERTDPVRGRYRIPVELARQALKKAPLPLGTEKP
jgi:hypothetical protein